MTLLVAGIVVLALSGIPALVLRSRSGEIISTLLVVLGCGGGLTAAVRAIASDRIVTEERAWQLPGALMALRLDALAAAFLLPVFVLGVLAAVYSLEYWPARTQSSAPRVRAFLGLLLAGMAGVIIAAHGIVFLVAWETMAIAAFFLIAADDSDADVRGAAWTYLIATHIGTLALIALFVLLRSSRGGTFLFGPVADTAATTAIFLLTLVGFGFKAGIVPLHFWLPGAHANAPSHISALLSGAMLKVGIYGIIRILLLIEHPPAWWGDFLIVAGLASALIAIALSLTQNDLKRALAYSSIENIGIITVAIGVWMLGRATGAPVLAALGLSAAIAHVWNHSLFKGLLFLGAGSVLHATGTRSLEAMGGLLQRMPRSGTLFIIGATAAAALPGANAFASEALLYFALIGSAPRVATLAAAFIALTGALAVACFVRLTGVIFLGAARTTTAARAHESPALMLFPLAVLGAACVALGVMPAIVARPLEMIVAMPGAITPFLRAIALPVQFAAAGTAVVLAALIISSRRSARRLTWDCGYAEPTARMQYTAGSLTEWFTARLMPKFLRPRIRVHSPKGLHPGAATFVSEIDEPFADRLLRPFATRWAGRAMRLRWMQQGRLPLYLLYIFVTTVAGVAWAIVFPLIRGGR